MKRGFAITALAFGASGCVHRPLPIDEYLPLSVGNEWTWEQFNPAGTKTETQKILREEKGTRGETRFVVDVAGERYYVRDPHAHVSGYSVAAGIWSIFLHEPLTLGARFDGGLTTNEGFHVEGEEAEAIVSQRPDQPMLAIPSSGYKVVTSLHRSVTVPAGTFPDCVEISHVSGQVIGVKYFARNVGLVLSEAWVEDRGRRSMISRQSLVKYVVKSAPQEHAR